MPIDLSVVNPVWAELLPGSNYCTHLQLNGSVVSFTTPSNSKADILSHLTCHTKSKLLWTRLFSQQVAMWMLAYDLSQCECLLWSIHHRYLMGCLNRIF